MRTRQGDGDRRQKTARLIAKPFGWQGRTPADKMLDCTAERRPMDEGEPWAGAVLPEASEDLLIAEAV